MQSIRLKIIFLSHFYQCRIIILLGIRLYRTCLGAYCYSRIEKKFGGDQIRVTFIGKINRVVRVSGEFGEREIPRVSSDQPFPNACPSHFELACVSRNVLHDIITSPGMREDIHSHL